MRGKAGRPMQRVEKWEGGKKANSSFLTSMLSERGEGGRPSPRTTQNKSKTVGE